MNKVKNAVYIIGGTLLVVKIFFQDRFSNNINSLLWILTGIILLIIIALELITRRE